MSKRHLKLQNDEMLGKQKEEKKKNSMREQKGNTIVSYSLFTFKKNQADQFSLWVFVRYVEGDFTPEFFPIKLATKALRTPKTIPAEVSTGVVGNEQLSHSMRKRE